MSLMLVGQLDCTVCGGESERIVIDGEFTLTQLLEKVPEHQREHHSDTSTRHEQKGSYGWAPIMDRGDRTGGYNSNTLPLRGELLCDLCSCVISRGQITPAALLQRVPQHLGQRHCPTTSNVIPLPRRGQPGGTVIALPKRVPGHHLRGDAS